MTPYQMWENRLGLETGQLARSLWESGTWSLAERGHITESEYWQRVGGELGVNDQEQVDLLRRELWSTWVVDDQVLSLIDRVRARYRVAMLSNATDALEDMLANRYRVADRFETIINSARLGMAKPEEAIYRETLRRLELEPGEVVFVDDRAENIAAAASMGIHVIWFVHGNELERQLAAYLNHGPHNGKGTHANDGDVVSSPENTDQNSPAPPQ